MANDLFDIPDWRLLRYFSVVAEEGSLRRAADRLYMTQPPLSRHMRHLEEMLGLTLFERHSRGLTLTEAGLAVLRIARPVLESQDAAGSRLRRLGHGRSKPKAPLSVGLTTAFEQGVFAGFIKKLDTLNGSPVRYVRQPSPQLARGVHRGRLNASLVALPLDAAGVHAIPLPYAEPLLAALPAAWLADLPRAGNGAASLQDLNGKTLFWFRRENNPAYFDHMRGIFTHVGFAPVYLEEPEEHDVLLARIAQGDGMGILPRSFSAIGRRGVVFCPLAEGGLLELRLGLVLQAGGYYGTDGSADQEDEPETASQLRRIITEAAHFLGTA